MAVACSDAGVGVITNPVARPVEVDVDGPYSTLGAWRYYRGTQVLECEVRFTATARGGSSSADAEWQDATVQLYDLRSGRYVGTDYMYEGEMTALWGSDRIESGERRVTRELRYTSYAPFRAHFVVRYRSAGETYSAGHIVDCR